jgi:2-polyprenyl-3-methyl-5-hydroxy-6-metoxy-1,4-benzoquinol methylase
MYKDEKFWDRIASKFDKLEKNDISYQIFIKKARKYLKPHNAVLDFGCGTGLICNEIAENVRSIYAMDISTNMIEISKKKAKELNIQNIEFARTSIFDEKFKVGSFDTIIAFNIFHLLEEPQKYFQRLHQILKPGGLIISSTPCMSEAPLLNRILKIFSFIGMTPKLNSFTSSEMEQLLLGESFKTIELNRIKPKSPIYLCILEKKNE